MMGYQLILGHRKLESNITYLGIKIVEALEVSESIDAYMHCQRLTEIELTLANLLSPKKTFY
jgi:hypothetical protein